MPKHTVAPTPDQVRSLSRVTAKELAAEIGGDPRTAAIARAGGPVTAPTLYALVAAAERLGKAG